MAVQRRASEHEIQDYPDNNADGEIDDKKLKYPRSVFFIVSNEFCERFSFYGMRTILTLYLRNKLNYDDSMSIVIYHVFAMFVYFFPLIGAMLSDSWLGKFRTIFYLSIVYSVGQIILSVSATPLFSLGLTRGYSLLGLLLIAIGTGGIKPCVAAFGGDQFILPQQERYLSMFFSLFYFSINSGSLISTFFTPLLRSNVTCFGETSCYSLAFFVPAILMSLSIVIFIAGKPLYRIIQPTGNVVLNVTRCISHGVYNKIKSKGAKKNHWLDYADDKYDAKLIQDIKATLQVLKLFLPLPLFWALYDQQGSRWTIQATRMNGEVGGFVIQPDQMQVANPLFVLALIPLFETVLYPLLAKVGLSSPLKKLTMGGLLAALAFVISAVVEFNLEKTFPVLPSQGLAQVRIFNPLNCPVYMEIQNEPFTLKTMGMWKDIHVKAEGEVLLHYKADYAACHSAGFSSLNETITGTIKAKEAAATSVVATPDGLSHSYKDWIDKSKTGNPLVRGLLYVSPSEGERNSTLKFVKDGETVLKYEFNSSVFHESVLEEIKSDRYNIYINDQKVQTNVNLKLGGVYTILAFDIPSTTQKYASSTITVTKPNSIHILWLIPQYCVITMGEVMFSVTGLEFAFTQAPGSMKSLLQAAWLLTVAFGNLIVAIVAKASFFDRQIFEFILFAALMFVDIIIFAIMATFYKYVEVPDEDSSDEDMIMNVKNGTVNASYTPDEK